ncbi:MAG: 6-phosphofructokinase [Chloroflexi bacterium]|nr:6-phosphofructokinase [Chloroflexota bacterium]
MKRIGLLTSGGDAPGMNACIRAVVRSAVHRGIEVIGIRRGYSGILAREFVRLNRRGVANIIQRGGTILESSRCDEFKTREGRRQGIQILEEKEIEGLVVVGGDGSFRGAAAMGEESEIKVIGVPATIDNDVYGTDYTIGFDSAVNTALGAIDRIRDTADAFERIFFVEVMGQLSGFIALEVGIAGGAEEVIVPEAETDPESLCESLKESFKRGKRSSIIIVAEGNEVGHTVQIAQYVKYRLKVDCRVCVLGHLQRGGPPTARDRVLASKLGLAAVDGILNGKEGHMVGEVRGEVVYVPLRDTWEKKKKLDLCLLKSLKVLAM